MIARPAPVVFIPALLCDEQMYRDVIADLGDVVDAHVLLSPKPTLEASAADILARAPEKFALVGTSYGGNLALKVALAAPERVSALWLMGCDPAVPKPGGPDLAAALDGSPDAVIEMLSGLVVRKEDVESADVFKAMARRVGGAAGAAQARAAGSRTEMISHFGKLKMPALVLWGEDDAIAPVAVGRALAEALPNAKFEVFKACGHLPTLEKPAESAALFRAFLTTTAASAP
ncbi:alpha/beta fold hydrolase [Variovorax sp. RHLX14]|uniref:alpha/beta fold hydrolase n=1 Tax=Variovorax sp. RHLX14 TaxID=1259731 RepID=UPI003F45CB1C